MTPLPVPQTSILSILHIRTNFSFLSHLHSISYLANPYSTKVLNPSFRFASRNCPPNLPYLTLSPLNRPSPFRPSPFFTRTSSILHKVNHLAHPSPCKANGNGSPNCLASSTTHEPTSPYQLKRH